MKNKILILILIGLILKVKYSLTSCKEISKKILDKKDQRLIFQSMSYLSYYNSIINSKKLIVSSKINHEETLENFFIFPQFIFSPKKEQKECYVVEKSKLTQNFFICIDSAPFFLDNNNLAIKKDPVFLANYIKKYQEKENNIIPFIYIEEICVNKELKNQKFGKLSFALLLKKIFNNNKINHIELYAAGDTDSFYYKFYFEDLIVIENNFSKHNKILTKKVYEEKKEEFETMIKTILKEKNMIIKYED